MMTNGKIIVKNIIFNLSKKNDICTVTKLARLSHRHKLSKWRHLYICTPSRPTRPRHWYNRSEWKCFNTHAYIYMNGTYQIVYISHYNDKHFYSSQLFLIFICKLRFFSLGINLALLLFEMCKSFICKNSLFWLYVIRKIIMIAC